jgi:hypothetical protein
MKFNKSDIVRAARTGIPRDRYTVRCTKAEKGQSDKGFEMSVGSFEIISPESITGPDGAETMIAGSQFKVWFCHEPTKDWGQARIMEFADRCGLSEEAQEDTDVFRQELVNKSYNWILSSEEAFKRYGKNDPNPDKRGQFILDENGQQISNGFMIKADIQDAISQAH